MNIQVIGLIIDIAGALMLFFATEKLNGIVVKLLKHYQLNSSGFDRDKIPYEWIKELDIRKNESAFWTYLGVGLLIVGFVLQTIVSWK